ncbi:MAG: DUF2027 domain-containing protein [Bacteroidales bacterium]|nr:DUF2027 domain-containing protein [Bacteroidales bacterium]MEE1322685.1 DUF2027 domain-containing protein [Bacteroidales bacterium]
MAKFKIGDKVKFLSSEGGGIIKGFSATNVANVEVDGFEIPTMVSDLVLDYCEDDAGKFFCTKQEENKSDKQEEQTYAPSYSDDSRISPLYLNAIGRKQEEGLYLCFVPEDQKWFISGDIDVYLINNSQNRIIYSILLLKEDGFVSEDFGTLEKMEKIHLETISREQISKWEKGAIQILFHNDKDTKVLMPCNCELKLRGSKFFKEGCYVETGFFSEKALMYEVCKMITISPFVQTSIVKEEDKITKEENLVVNVAKRAYTNTFLDKHLVNANTAEIDLHIGELVEDYYLLENDQMLKIQLEYARKCLNEAIIQGISKIIFIHGVGQGILKSELIKELNKYQNIHYFDASMAKYGVGATEVYIGKRE